MTSKAATRLGFRAVSPQKRPTVHGAYDIVRISAEIEAVRRKQDKTVKETAAAVGIDRKVWYKKRDLDGSSFSFRDISLLAEYFDAPPGWPYIPWELAEDFDRWRKSR